MDNALDNILRPSGRSKSGGGIVSLGIGLIGTHAGVHAGAHVLDQHQSFLRPPSGSISMFRRRSRADSVVPSLTATIGSSLAASMAAVGAGSVGDPLAMANPTRMMVTKAAAISSAMLARKASVMKERESVVDKGDEPVQATDLRWFSKPVFQNMIKWACFFSMVSVSLQTPETYAKIKYMCYVTYGVDLYAALVFTIEFFAKLKHKGFVKNDRSYFRDRWCQFDFFMLLCHLVSLLPHTWEVIEHRLPLERQTYSATLGIVRSPRPLIMIRFIRAMVKFQLPKNRIQQIFKRSSQQIYNVTIFFLFFMSLYGILGVQFFGRMEHHCVRRSANPQNVTIRDLAIPDTYCSPPEVGGGYQCPKNMKCVRLNITSGDQGYYGMFNHFGHSVFSVYMAASQEGWVYVMYNCLDSFSQWRAFFYFTTLIFFLAWLVKNVFIAVITETFAEIRVQFSQIWASREVVTGDEFKQILEKSEQGWRLVTIDANKPKGKAPQVLQQFQRSTAFQVMMIIIVLGNALFNATFVHKHNPAVDAANKLIYMYVEIAFTIFFNFESLFKIWCMGWKSYIRRGLHKFEIGLCIGSTLNIVPLFYELNVFTYFQVFRILRLIKASPMLEDFVYKIFGPGKKLGGLILFTMALLIITSSISLQLFCFVKNLDKFRTFPEALMSMFQILTQEGWTEIVVEAMRRVHDNVAPLVAVYFVAYHLFVTLIVLSLFVAVILDNLEMDEELKKIKQLKAREETTAGRTKLPLRLRIFTHFPDRPQMVIVKKLPGEFPLPKIRDSFTRQFADDDNEEMDEERRNATYPSRSLVGRANQIRKKQKMKSRLRQIGQLSSKTSVTYVVEDSNKMRMLLSDSLGVLPTIGRFGTQKAKKIGYRGLHSSLKMKQMYEHMKENGDLARPSDTAVKKDDKGATFDLKAFQQKKQQAEMTRNRLEEEIRENHPFFDRPLFAVGRDSKFRRCCQWIVYAKYIPTVTDLTSGKQINRKYKELHEFLGLMTYLDWTMVILTCCSCVSMMFERPWPRDLTNMIFVNKYLQIADYMFVVAMTFELMLKILANGLFFTPKAVIRDVGGIMTMFIYITSLVFLLWMPTQVQINSGAQLLMICRAMRPLRIYTLVPHIRRVVVELCKGFKEILLVTVLLVVLMFIFASFGVQIAGGKLAKCNDPNITARIDCKGRFTQRVYVTKLEVYGKDTDMHPHMVVPRVWANPRNFDFDHAGNAMLALFEILSYKGWNVVRDVILERLGAWPAVFVHIYVFVGCMIGLTLFVGVVIANYSENRGTALLTVDQRRWNDLKNRLKMAQPLHVPPRPPESSRLRRWCYDVARGNSFKRFFTMCVLVNSCLLCIPWNKDEAKEQRTLLTLLTVCSGFITLLFVIEIIIKIMAFSLSGFWQSRRNRVDFVIVLLGLFWCVLHFLIALPSASFLATKVSSDMSTTMPTSTMSPYALNGRPRPLKKPSFDPVDFTYRLGCVVVVLRFFTIAGRHSTLKMLMLTVLMSMFRSFFIIIAMFLLMLFYAYTGVILFGMVKYGQAVNRHANFRTASKALVVLFRIVTGEDWNEVMHDCMRSLPLCIGRPYDNYWNTDCGNHYGAIIFFCSFYLIITYIVLNLLVAIIMENFSLFYSSDEDALLSYADIRNFQLVWNIVDKEQKKVIPIHRVKFLLRLLKGRLEVDPSKDRLLFKHMCFEMERLHNGEDVSFHDVLSMLSYRSVDIRKSLQLEELLGREELEYVIEEEVAKQTIRSWLEACLRRMRAKEQNSSIINSLRATTEALLEHMEPSETMGSTEKDERTRKKGLGTKGSRRSSISGVVAEAAKKFLVSAKKTAHWEDHPITSIECLPLVKRSSLKISPVASVSGITPVTTVAAVHHDLTEVSEETAIDEDMQQQPPSEGRTDKRRASIVSVCGSGSAGIASASQSSGVTPSPQGPVAVGSPSGASMTHVPEIGDWWDDTHAYEQEYSPEQSDKDSEGDNQ